ncbi:MAG TPA: hypothetical protein VGL63_08595 [Streptosporangiaceae bacterium]|jgi:hypothetical protein
MSARRMSAQRMSAAVGRRVSVLLGTVVTATAGLVAAGSAAAPAQAAAPAVACTGTTGVTVVVDFTALGGKVKTACDPKNPATGLAALTGAGFSYSFVPRVPGFVCRINARPKPCNGAPITAYWSYWHAKPHGTWIYSSLGAGTYNPAPGTVQGWAFGAGTAPRISPP